MYEAFLCSFVQNAFVRPKEKSLFLIFVAGKLSLKEFAIWRPVWNLQTIYTFSALILIEKLI